MVVNLLPHQSQAIEKMHNGCVLTGGVGTGKTITSLGYFWLKELHGFINDLESIRTPRDIYIFTTARKRDDMDWQEWGVRFGLYKEREVSAGHILITVDSYNNIDKYKEVKNAFIILDEQRMVGSGTWSKTFIHLAKSNRWIMLSATPGDRWEDYIPLFIANGFYKNRTEFKRDHCIYSYFGNYPKLEKYVGVNKLVKLKNAILVPMPYERHTTRHIQTVEVSYDKVLFDKVVKKRWNPYTEKPLKDVGELYRVMRMLVNSDTSRLTALRDLMEKHPRLIVFYNFNYELEILRGFASSMGATTSTNTKSSKDLSENSKTSSILENSETTQNPSIFEEPAWTTLTTSDTTNSSIFTKEKSGQPLNQNLSEMNPDTQNEYENLNERPPRSSLTEAYLSESTEDPTTANETSTILSRKHSLNGSKTLPKHMSVGLEPDRSKKLLQPSESQNSWSTSTDESATRKTLDFSDAPGELLKTPLKFIGDGEKEIDTMITANGSTDGLLLSSSGTMTGPNNPWIDTIWSKDYIPPADGPDPRDSVQAIRARELFEKHIRKQRYKKSNSESYQDGFTTEKAISSTHPSSNPTMDLELQSKSQRSNPTSQNGISTVLTVAEWNGQKHEAVPDSERWLYFVQYAAGAEAWDCITTDAMVFYSRTYVYRIFQQAQGRTDRLNTPFSDLYYYDLASKSYIDIAIGRAQKDKRDFNEMDDMRSNL